MTILEEMRCEGVQCVCEAGSGILVLLTAALTAFWRRERSRWWRRVMPDRGSTESLLDGKTYRHPQSAAALGLLAIERVRKPDSTEALRDVLLMELADRPEVLPKLLGDRRR